MDIKELIQRLKKLGINESSIPERTIKRWAFIERSIPKPTTAQLKGPGQTSDWSEEALEKVAAVWAVRHNEKGVRITKARLDIIKRLAELVCTGGYVIYRLPPIVQSHRAIRAIPYEQIHLQFAHEGMHNPDGSGPISHFPGDTEKQRADLLDALIVTWIATIAKVRWTRRQEELARREGRSSPAVWPLEKKAVVFVLYQCTPYDYEATGITGQSVVAWQSQHRGLLVGGETDGDGDKIMLFENGEDVRVLLARSLRFNTPLPLSLSG
jgi:hypothetical protein